MGTNVVINILLSGSLAVLWGLINSLQIVAHFTLFVVRFPDNAQICYDLMLSLATFKIIPTDDIAEITKETFGLQTDAVRQQKT